MHPRTMRILEHRRWPWAVAGLAVSLALPSLGVGLLIDDLLQHAILRGLPSAREYFGGPWAMFDFADGNPERTRRLMDWGFMPWWALDTARFAFFRPLAVLTHRIDYVLWPNSVPLMHAQNLAWFAAMIVLAAAVYRRFLGIGVAAGLAALLYAVDDAHAMPAAWIANRNGLLSACFGFMALLCHDRWRRDGKGGMGAAGLFALALSLLSNEGGVATCAYLFAYSLFMDPAPRGRALATLAPYAVVVLLWRIGYQWAGYGIWACDLYIDPAGSPLRFTGAVAKYLPALLLGQWALPPSDFFFFYPGPIRTLVAFFGILLLAGIAVVLARLLRRDPVSRFLALGMVLSVVPICSTVPSDRLLPFVGLGAMGLIGQFMAVVWHGRCGMIPHQRDGAREAYPNGLWRAAARAVFAGFVVIHLVLAPLLFPLRIYGFLALCNHLNRAYADIPLDQSDCDKTAVFLNAPNPFYTAYLLPYRLLQGQPIPARVRALGPTFPFPKPFELTRIGDRTIEVVSEHGFPANFVRDWEHRLALGERVDLDGVRICVAECNAEGWPSRVVYDFDRSLDSVSFRWFLFEDDRFVACPAPIVGKTQVLNRDLGNRFF